jgi:hypothetical protein
MAVDPVARVYATASIVAECAPHHIRVLPRADLGAGTRAALASSASGFGKLGS